MNHLQRYGARGFGEHLYRTYMSLKTAASLAFAGTCLVTIMLIMDFIKTVSGVINDVIPAMTLLRLLVFLFASLGVTFFFVVFHRAQH
jgi:hypothetical protein